MKSINTTNFGRITRQSNKRVTARNRREGRFINIIVCSFVLFQLALHAAACEDMEDQEGYMETVEEAKDIEVSNTTQFVSCCGKDSKCSSRPSVMQFVLVNAETDEDIRVLQDGDVIDLNEDGPDISIRADVHGHVGKVVFSLNDSPRYHTEYYRPYYIAADNGHNNVYPWKVEPGEYTLKATPYWSRYWYHSAGKSKTIEFSVIDSGSVEYKDVTFTNTNSEKLLDIDDSSTSEGAEAIQLMPTGNESQLWTIRTIESGLYEIINQNSEMCLALDKDPGVNIVQKTCNTGDAGQQWQIASSGGGTYKVINAQNDNCMDVEGGSIGNGAAVIQNDCDGTVQSQKWTIQGFNQ